MSYEVLHNRAKQQTEVRYAGQVVGTYVDDIPPQGVAEWWHRFLNLDRIPLPVLIDSVYEPPDR